MALFIFEFTPLYGHYPYLTERCMKYMCPIPMDANPLSFFTIDIPPHMITAFQNEYAFSQSFCFMCKHSPE